MAKEKPSLPKGVRDFLPEQIRKRRFIFRTIQRVFEKYGFEPIETPTFGNLSVLTGKYGEEGDRLIFKILNSGDYLSKIPAPIDRNDSAALASHICEKALRYDLTVPLARFVVMHQHELVFPFKRYQIQNVWRADRPQKGRYREFSQCDADVIGSHSLLHEVDCVLMYDEALSELGLQDFTIHLNHRKILAAVVESIDEQERFVDICIVIDKLDKIGMEGVEKELLEKGFSSEKIKKLRMFFEIEGSPVEKLKKLADLLQASSTGREGILEMETILSHLSLFPLRCAKINLDLTLARGLNYYTGTIFEVRVNNFEMGSIGGGGRYDNLTGMFGLEGYGGIGISFGADRIYDVLEGLNLFQQLPRFSTQVLLVYFGEAQLKYSLEILQQIRAAGISAEIYPEAAKLAKQFGYADKKKIPYVLTAGPSEQEQEKVVLKQMTSGQQEEVAKGKIVDKLLDLARNF